MATRILESPSAPSPSADPAAIDNRSVGPDPDPAPRQWTCARCGAGAAIGEYFVDAGKSGLILESLRRQHLAVCEAP